MMFDCLWANRLAPVRWTVWICFLALWQSRTVHVDEEILMLEANLQSLAFLGNPIPEFSANTEEGFVARLLDSDLVLLSQKHSNTRARPGSCKNLAFGIRPDANTENHSWSK